MNSFPEIIGLVPAAGNAERLSPTPGSKEIFPLGFYQNEKGDFLPKASCLYLLEKMQQAKITKTIIIFQNGKWDIPAYLSRQKTVNINFSYIVTEKTDCVPFTLDIAYPYIQHAVIAFGFPDIIFQTKDAFIKLLAHNKESNADIILGLFPTKESYKKDMVKIDDSGAVQRIYKNPSVTDLIYTWCIALWQPTFSKFMHQFLKNVDNLIPEKTGKIMSKNELSIGEIIQAAINKNLKIQSVCFERDTCIDIGTPEDLVKAIRLFYIES